MCVHLYGRESNCSPFNEFLVLWVKHFVELLQILSYGHCSSEFGIITAFIIKMRKEIKAYKC